MNWMTDGWYVYYVFVTPQTHPIWEKYMFGLFWTDDIGKPLFAAIAVALWAWWRNSWWMTHAYTVYAYAAADVLLILVCAALCGGFRRTAWLREEPVAAKMPA